MIIGIDGNEANVTNRVGINAYAYALLTQLYKQHTGSFTYNIYLKNKPQIDLPEVRNFWKYTIIKPKKLWTQIALPFALFAQFPRPDVFFSPTHYAPRFSPMPVVISVMDLSYIYFSDMFNKNDLYQLKHWTAYSVRRASRVLTISNASKNDIIKTYGVSPEKIAVTYPGLKILSNTKEKNMTINELQKKYKITEKYILFVGTLQPRKNITSLIEAFSLAHKLDSALQLVIVGKRGWLYQDILTAPKKFHIEDSVLFLEFVSDADLAVLYSQALCFVLPSLYEGFGLPVLEAMSHGCPVITSNISSLPEAGGDAAIYIDPYNPHNIAEKIILLVKDKNLRVKLKERGYQQIKKFSWEKTARQTLTVLEEVAHSKKLP